MNYWFGFFSFNSISKNKDGRNSGKIIKISKEAKKQRSKETKKQRNKEKKKQRSKETQEVLLLKTGRKF